MTARWRAQWEANDARWSAFFVIAVAIAASASGLGNLFAYDDIPVLVENPMVTGLHSPIAYLTDSYWGPSRGNSLYRPLTVAFYAVQWALGKGSAFPFHLANVLLYAASALAALTFFRLFLKRTPALVAGLAFAAHPVHTEAV